MIELNIKHEAEKVFAEYLLQPSDRADNLTVGMFMNNDIDGICPFIPGNGYFGYDITGLVTMRDYFGEYVKKEVILNTFYQIAKVLKESVNYMIIQTSFYLDIDNIYVNQENGNVNLICIPLFSPVNSGKLTDFFKGVLFGIQFDPEEDGSYVPKLMNLINQKTFNLDGFIFEIEDMLGIEHVVLEEVFEEYPEEVSEEATEEAAEDKTAEQEETIEEAVKEVSEENVEEAAEEAVKEVPGEDSEEATEVVSEEATEEATEKNVEKAAEENAGEKAGEDASESVEGENPQNTDTEAEQNPVLINVKTDVVVQVNKDSFYIGSDHSSVDFCVIGNDTVDERHAYIIRHDDNFFVVDNNTMFGTFINRVQVTSDEEIPLSDGVKIRFGTEEFLFKING